MSVDADTVRRIAHLARIAVAESEVENLHAELNAMLAFVEQLQEVNVEGVEPMTSVTPMAMKKRPTWSPTAATPRRCSRTRRRARIIFTRAEGGGMMANASFDHPRASTARPDGISCIRRGWPGHRPRS